MSIDEADQAAAQPASLPAGDFKTGDTSMYIDALPLAATGAVEPSRVRLFRGPHGVLRCTVEGEMSVLHAKVVRAFPLSSVDRWITILDGKNKEVCLIEDPNALDAKSRRLAEEEIGRYYRIASIERILSIRNEYRTMYWDVVTHAGRRDFVVKWSSDCIIWLAENELMLVDVDTNRFYIADTTRLDPLSRRQLAILT